MMRSLRYLLLASTIVLAPACRTAQSAGELSALLRQPGATLDDIAAQVDDIAASARADADDPPGLFEIAATTLAVLGGSGVLGVGGYHAAKRMNGGARRDRSS
jgi:hypothetical protein